MDSHEHEPHNLKRHTQSQENDFKTPEQVARESALSEGSDPDIGSGHGSSEGLTIKNVHKHLWNKFQDLTTRQKVIVIFIVVLILGGVGTWTALALKSKPVKGSTAVVNKPKVVAKPTTVASVLTGLPVAPSVNQGPVTGIMIENSLDARPQSGLINAGIVFEALAEGGVTRFLALYQNDGPSSIGPVRSLRPYFLGWDLGFDAPIAHVGGSPEALSDLSSWGGRDLDEFYNGGSYTRITSRAAPHNVYTSMASLTALELSKGYTSSSFTSFPRKADAPAKQPNATSIDLSLSSYDYNPHYDYSAATNSYNRSIDGSPDTDEVSGAQISPKVVIAMVVPWSQGSLDSSGAYYSIYGYIGSGVADIFQDGTVKVGTWNKTSNTSQITFLNSSGNTIKLDAGQTWITVVSSTSEISYK